MSEPRGTRRQRNAPTISDVAAKAGVSPMTVSRVINGESNVRAETRKKVEAAIKALDYSPSSAARTLAGGEEIRIGLLHSNPSFNYLSQLLVGSLDQASRLNVQLIVEKCDDEAEEASAVEHLIRARLDGIMLTPPLSESLPVLEAIHKRNIPVVAVATGRAPDWALSVSINDHAAAYEMTRHSRGAGAYAHRLHQGQSAPDGERRAAAGLSRRAAGFGAERCARADRAGAVHLPFGAGCAPSSCSSWKSRLPPSSPPMTTWRRRRSRSRHRRGLDVPSDPDGLRLRRYRAGDDDLAGADHDPPAGVRHVAHGSGPCWVREIRARNASTQAGAAGRTSWRIIS